MPVINGLERSFDIGKNFRVVHGDQAGENRRNPKWNCLQQVNFNPIMCEKIKDKFYATPQSAGEFSRHSSGFKVGTQRNEDCVELMDQFPIFTVFNFFLMHVTDLNLLV